MIELMNERMNKWISGRTGDGTNETTTHINIRKLVDLINERFSKSKLLYK